MVAFKLLLAVTVSSLVAAWPEPTAIAKIDNRAIDCSKSNGCIGVLKKIGPPASSFCRSYLKVPGTKTTTTTITPVAVYVHNLSFHKPTSEVADNNRTSTTSTTTVTVTSSVCGQSQKRNENQDLEIATVEDIDKRTDVLALLADFAAAKVRYQRDVAVSSCSLHLPKPPHSQLLHQYGPSHHHTTCKLTIHRL